MMIFSKVILYVYLVVTISMCYAKSITDNDIDMQIQMLYEKNPILNQKKLHSQTEQNKVILKGCVRNSAEKQLAEDLAGLVDYIDSIDNKIKVTAPPTSSKNTSPVKAKISDSLISRLVHSKLMLEPSLCSAKIHVSTLNGITILSGKVSSMREKKQAYTIALMTQGVIEVINKLTVDRT